MSRLFDDMNPSNILTKEWEMVQGILKSERGALLVKTLIITMSDMDDKASPFFLGLISEIGKVQSERFIHKIHNMQGCMFALGQVLTMDKIISGKSKGTPRFLTKKFKDTMEVNAWYMLEYIQEFANFYEFGMAKKHGTRSDIPKASEVCQCDDVKLEYVRRFCKFLDDMDKTNMDNLVNPQVFECNQGLKDMVMWCKNNRREWDDISSKAKGGSK